jgi:hypothetical protein
MSPASRCWVKPRFILPQLFYLSSSIPIVCCRRKISNRFAALEHLDTEVDINRAWETIRESIKMSAKESLDYYELKKHKPWLMKDAQNC